jgi:parvulin-like peptidyl-prolyl isomerase
MAIGDVVESQNGFHVIQVLERDDDRPFDLETIEVQKADLWRNWISTAQVQPEVKNYLSPEKRDWILRQLGGLRRL